MMTIRKKKRGVIRHCKKKSSLQLFLIRKFVVVVVFSYVDVQVNYYFPFAFLHGTFFTLYHEKKNQCGHFDLLFFTKLFRCRQTPASTCRPKRTRDVTRPG